MDSIQEVGDNLEIMIVDGNSTDRTREIALKKVFVSTLNQEKATAGHTVQVSSLQKVT